MKWCRFQVGDKVRYGIVEDEARVIEVTGTPFDTYTVTATTYPLSTVKLLVPVIPPTFYAGGLNYPAHVQWWVVGPVLWYSSPRRHRARHRLPHQQCAHRA